MSRRSGGAAEGLMWLIGFIIFAPLIASLFVVSFTQVMVTLAPIGVLMFAVFFVVYLVRTRW